MTEQQIDLPITGMTCASCVRNVERALNKMDGVEANVNLATERATISFDGSSLQVADLINKVDNAGYGVAQATVELPITGMTCASCVRNVERAINKVPGILEVNVNLATERASVHYIPGTVHRADIIKAVENSGYGVVDAASDAELDDAEQKAREAEINHQKFLVKFGALLTIPLFIMSMSRMSGVLPDSWEWVMWEGWPFIFGLMATPVIAVVGKQYIIGAYKAARNKTTNMDTLIAMGSLTAYITPAILGGSKVLMLETLLYQRANSESLTVLILSAARFAEFAASRFPT